MVEPESQFAWTPGLGPALAASVLAALLARLRLRQMREQPTGLLRKLARPLTCGRPQVRGAVDDELRAGRLEVEVRRQRLAENQQRPGRGDHALGGDARS